MDNERVCLVESHILNISHIGAAKTNLICLHHFLSGRAVEEVQALVEE